MTLVTFRITAAQNLVNILGWNVVWVVKVRPNNPQVLQNLNFADPAFLRKNFEILSPRIVILEGGIRETYLVEGTETRKFVTTRIDLEENEIYLLFQASFSDARLIVSTGTVLTLVMSVTNTDLPSGNFILGDGTGSNMRVFTVNPEPIQEPDPILEPEPEPTKLGLTTNQKIGITAVAITTVVSIGVALKLMRKK